MMRATFVLLGLALGAPALEAATPFVAPIPVTRELPNGLEVAVFPKPGSGLVSLTLLVPAGTIAEPDDQAGVATVTAEMLRRGTTSRDAATWALELHRLGGELGAVTGRDHSTLSGNFLARDFETVAELMSDAVRFPRFDTAELQNVVAQTARMAALQAGAGAEDQTLRALFGDHPYARGPYGSRESLGRLSTQALRTFHATHWVPRGAALAIAGDVTPDRAFQIAVEWFGPWAGGEAREVVRRAVNPPPSVRVIVVDRAGLRADARIATLAPARGAADEPALTLAAQLYGGAPAERRGGERFGFDREVRTYYLALRDAGVFSAGVSVAADSAADAVARLIEGMRALHRPHTPDALVSARSYVRQSFPLGLESPAQRSAAWLVADYYGQPVAPPAVDGVSPAAVAEAARRWMDPERVVIVVAGPAASLELALARFGPVTVVRTESESATASAPPPPPAPRPAPTGAEVTRARQILRKALDAHGGVTRLRGIKDSRTEADLTLVVQGQPYEGVMIQVRQEPDRMVYVSEIGNLATRQTLVGDRGWQVVGGDTVATDLDSTMVRGLRAGFGSDLPHLLLMANDPRSVLRPNRSENWDGVDALGVVVEAPGQPARTLFFHPEDGRLLGFDQGEGEGMVARRRFGNYRAVQGILWPHDEERLLAGETVMRVHVRDVRLNAGIGKDVFARP